jgi:Orotate phosphoribosyltransferase homologs
MKNVDNLIESATELAGRGLSRGEIADELNVSRETASWLVERGGVEHEADSQPRPTASPQDIHVDWSAIGRDSRRLTHVSHAMADLISKDDTRSGSRSASRKPASRWRRSSPTSSTPTSRPTAPQNTSGRRATSRISTAASPKTLRRSPRRTATSSTTLSPRGRRCGRRSPPSATAAAPPSAVLFSLTNRALMRSMASPSPR